MYTDFDHQILTKHAFALVDPSALEFLPEGVVAVPVVPPKMAASAHLMPGLVDVGSLSEAVKSELLTMLYLAQKNREAPVIAMFIAADITADEFARHWNRLQIATPSSETQFWLRLHDPRVLHQLLRILSASQWNKLLGPLSGFTYWAGDAWVNAGRQSNEDLLSRMPWPWHRVSMIGIVNRSLAEAGITDSALLHEKGAAVEDLTAIASARFNLSDQPDLIEFAVRGLINSPVFYEHPKVAPAMRPSDDPEDDSRLSDRLALISNTIWADMKSTESKNWKSA